MPQECLARAEDCAADFRTTDPGVLGTALPIRGVAGDQHAALAGQACFACGDVKSTYGTGAFLMLNTADRPVRSSSRLLMTVAYRLNGRSTYAPEGSILSASATVQWLRDGLGLIG